MDLEHKNFNLTAKSRDEAIGISLEIIEPAELVAHEFRRTREFLPRTKKVDGLGDEAFVVDVGGIYDLYFRFGNTIVYVQHGPKPTTQRFAKEVVEEMKKQQ